MISHLVLVAINRCLRDITGLRNIPFGGKTFVLGGDFRQTLPIASRGHNLGIANYCVKSSDVWDVYQQYCLQQNMSLLPGHDQFNNFLLQLGSNRLPTKQEQPFRGSIQIPDQMIEQGNLIESIFPDSLPEDQVASRVILTPCNNTSLTIKQQILQRQVGDVTTYFTADHAEVPDNPDDYPQEFLHTLAPSGMQQHTLELQVGCNVMLLRNLDPTNGLCNGTRLFVRHLYRNSIRAEGLGGSHAGNLVLIPKVLLGPSDVHMPFQLCRIQLPVCLAYSMTISKAQGQPFQNVGLELPKPVFAHGQLYVALSRATTEKGVG